jgi:hypothetical protein
MIIRLPSLSVISVAIAIAALVSCDRPTEIAQPTAGPVDPGASSEEGVTFGDGFYKAEVTPKHTHRWVQQQATLRIQAPDAGNYRLTFKPFTAFTPAETVIEVGVNGKTAGTIATNTFDLDNIPPVNLEVEFIAGENNVTLKSNRPDVRLGNNDPRTVAFGLILPIKVERLP